MSNPIRIGAPTSIVIQDAAQAAAASPIPLKKVQKQCGRLENRRNERVEDRLLAAARAARA